MSKYIIITEYSPESDYMYSVKVPNSPTEYYNHADYNHSIDRVKLTSKKGGWINLPISSCIITMPNPSKSFILTDEDIFGLDG